MIEIDVQPRIIGSVLRRRRRRDAIDAWRRRRRRGDCRASRGGRRRLLQADETAGLVAGADEVSGAAIRLQEPLAGPHSSQPIAAAKRLSRGARGAILS